MIVMNTSWRLTSLFFRKSARFPRYHALSRACCHQKAANVAKRTLPASGPGLAHFLHHDSDPIQQAFHGVEKVEGKNRVYFEIYGCQMNVNDADVVWSILSENGYVKSASPEEADVILVVTCSIREGAEAKVWRKLQDFAIMRRKRKKVMRIGILGCMAERLKSKLLEGSERLVDVVCGPDAYRDLPRLLHVAESGESAMNVALSLEETYADISPVRLDSNSVTAFVSIMRGCDNMCSYCIVPFTRGRERSRPMDSIVGEVRGLVDEGVREVTLLGQNVNSYRDLSTPAEVAASVEPSKLARGFKTIYKPKKGGRRFAELLSRVAEVDPNLRIRFTSPHPKDFPDEVLQAIRDYPNICKFIHLPAQSGNSVMLERMRRGYTREAYLDLVAHVKEVVPGIGLSSDFICGFSGETEEQFADTLSLMEIVQYNFAYLFPYSMREKTHAHRRMVDDVPEDVKKRRLEEMAKVFRAGAEKVNRAQVGETQLVLVEGNSKRSDQDLAGRNERNTKVIFPKAGLDAALGKVPSPGDYVAVKILDSSSQSLKGRAARLTSVTDFYLRDSSSCEESVPVYAC